MTTPHIATLTENILQDPQQKEFIQNNIFDPWKNAPLQGYVWLNNKSKGMLGEKLVTELFRGMNYEVKTRTNSGHDAIINDIKTEIKFSVCCLNKKNNTLTDDMFVLNHISLEKDWERLVFFGYNSTRPHVSFWITKDMCKRVEKETNIFSHQQGGNMLKNDDYMVSGKKLIELSQSKYVRSLDKW